MYVHLLVCYLNKLLNARCNDKDNRGYKDNQGYVVECEEQFNTITTQINKVHTAFGGEI